jgi:hypothetical protein
MIRMAKPQSLSPPPDDNLISNDGIMTSSLIFHRPRPAPMLVAVAFIMAAITALALSREPVLRSIGWALVGDEPLAPADVIVVASDSGGAGVLEAADLVQSGIARRVAIFADPPRAEDLEFIRRGLPYEDEAAKQVRQLKSLNVTDIVQIPRTDVGTQGEAQVLPAWCDEHQFQSIVLVGAADHAHRLRRVLGRAMKGHSTRVMIRPTRYSSFDPDRWWHTRRDTRIAIVEIQKLALDILLHPGLF